MAKQRLFTEPPKIDDTRTPKQRFDALAAKVLSVPKTEIDNREKQWQKDRAEQSKPATE